MKEVLQQSNQTTKQWLKSSEVSKVLGISHVTFAKLKVGGIMFFKYEDIDKIVEAGLISKK